MTSGVAEEQLEIAKTGTKLYKVTDEKYLKELEKYDVDAKRI